MNYLGLDLGQKNDPTAIVIIERLDPVRLLRLRHAERVSLGTPYPRVVTRVQEILQYPGLVNNCALVVDATGVGAPVVDMLRGARLGCDLTAVMITGGDRQAQSGSTYNVPKRDLVASVQVLLERGELKIPRRLRQLSALLRELHDFRSIPGPNGSMRLGADGCGEHDDLVIALALACWRSKRAQNGYSPNRLPGL
jgi:hypothetical protein